MPRCIVVLFTFLWHIIDRSNSMRQDAGLNGPSLYHYNGNYAPISNSIAVQVSLVLWLFYLKATELETGIVSMYHGKYNFMRQVPAPQLTLFSLPMPPFSFPGIWSKAAKGLFYSTFTTPLLGMFLMTLHKSSKAENPLYEPKTGLAPEVQSWNLNLI